MVSEAWKAAYPGAAAGVLVMGNAANPHGHPEPGKRMDELEGRLRARFADRNAVRALRARRAYEAYSKRFKKTYHVLPRLESVVLKGKSIPRAGALVDATFMAEPKSLPLTAGHDLAVTEAR